MSRYFTEEEKGKMSRKVYCHSFFLWGKLSLQNIWLSLPLSTSIFFSGAQADIRDLESLDNVAGVNQ